MYVFVGSFYFILLTCCDQALTGMLEESTDHSLARKATLLMGEILQIANKVLPLSVASKIQVQSTYDICFSPYADSFCQTLPKLFDLASDYKDGPNRITGTTALSSIDSFNRNRTRLQPGAQKDGRPRQDPLQSQVSLSAMCIIYTCRANSVEESVRRGQRQAEQSKLKLGMQIDDKSFQNLLLESQVNFVLL